jgi:hypothetical protein
MTPLARHCRLLALIAALLTLTAMSSPLQAAGFVQGGQAQLREFKSKSYAVHTNLPRDEAMHFAEHMDRVFDEYRKRFRSFRSRRDIDMPLYLFKERDEYVAFLKAHNIDGTNTGGMFFYQQNVAGLATWTRGRPLADTYEVLQHEGFHQFAFAYIGTELPIWVNEGLAQYFEDAILTKTRMHLGLARERRVAVVQQSLENGNAIDFDELLTMSNDQWRKNVVTDQRKADLQYNQSWSVCYFLIHGDDGKYQKAFEDYLMRVSNGAPSGDAFNEAFGERDTTRFRAAWQRYAKAMRPDDISTAMSRMAFLGAGVQYFYEQENFLPKTMTELKNTLKSRGFRMTRTTHGVTVELKASDDALFQYTAGKRELAFELLKPEKDDLPPRVAATGLSPQPTLVWYREADGSLTQSTVWR